MTRQFFSSDYQVENHPQAKLLGWQLIRNKFNTSLSDDEIAILENGIDTQDLISIVLLTVEEQYRLLMCAIVSKIKPSSMEALFNFAKHTLDLPTTKLTEIFLLSDEPELLGRCLAEMSENEFRNLTFTDFILFLNELARLGLVSNMDLLLNYSLNDGRGIKDSFKTTDYPYGIACENGQLAIIQYLEGIDDFDRKAAAEVYDYDAYVNACKNGHLVIIQHLEAIAGFDKKAAAEAKSYYAYSEACKNGHLAIIQHLEAIAGFDKKAAAEAKYFSAYSEACKNGHLAIIQHLEAIEGFDKRKAAEFNDYEAYCLACMNDDLVIIQHLHQIPSCLSYAEKNDAKYGKKYIYPFVFKKLATLQQDTQAFNASNPNGVFDVGRERAKICFIMLRNLIRRGGTNRYVPENVSDEIRFLLSIPAVRDLCHQRVDIESLSPGQENELLRIARNVGNRDAAILLLKIPEVRERAEAANYYACDYVPEYCLNLRAIDESIQASLLVPSCQVLMQKRKVVQDTDDANITKYVSGLPEDIVSHIASYLHPKGQIVKQNMMRFFYVREVNMSPLTKLNIDINKVKQILGLDDASTMIKNVLTHYKSNLSLSLKTRKDLTKAFVLALQKIDSTESQALVLKTLSDITDEATEGARISSSNAFINKP